MAIDIQINNNDIQCSFEYQVIENITKININQSSDINLNIINHENEVVLFFAPEIEVNLVSTLEGTSLLKLSYILSKDSKVNEFVVNESDDVIKVVKQVKVLDNAFYESSIASFSDNNIDYSIVVNLDAPSATGYHNIAAISKDNYKKVFNVTINNNVRNTFGELNNFGVVKDSAHLIFNGTGFIKKNAKQAQAHQASKIITFNDGVNAQANPYLIIDENDVQASHAAAVGAMDSEQLFYLQSRGINFDQASQLITYGYLNPIIAKIKNEVIKVHLQEIMEAKVGL